MTRSFLSLVIVVLLLKYAAAGNWQVVYREPFDSVPVGTRTDSKKLPQWEGGSAAGTVFDGRSKVAGRFLVASSAWTSFNQGPILNLDLNTVPHDRVRVRFDLYTFGDWRGNQQATGGPQHRLMFFDSKSEPRFSFSSTFATNPEFAQAWPQRQPAEGKALRGAKRINADATGRFRNAYRWPIEFEYPTESAALRFTVLCGAAAGSGAKMPPFGIDNVEVSVRSTAPMIILTDREEDVRRAKNNPPTQPGAQFDIDVPSAGRTSVGVFDRLNGRLIRTLRNGEPLPAGRHSLLWDGLDNRGQPVPAGKYEWRSITTPGFAARYVTTIGINPPGGEHPQPRRSWVGDHVGAGIVDVDDSGVYIGSPTTEGLMMLAKVDAAKTKVVWRREQFYQSGRLTKAATSGTHVFMLHPNGKLRRLNRDNGRVEAEWQIAEKDKAPNDIDTRGENLVVADRSANKVRWLFTRNGKDIAAVQLTDPVCVAAIEEAKSGLAIVGSGSNLFRVQPGRQAEKVATLNGIVSAIDFDPKRKELWAVLDGCRVVRLDEQHQVTQTYGDRPREFGPYDPTQFAGLYDIAADLHGGFFVGEPGHPPRRVAHIARDGSVVDQWFGGMSFYVGGTFDPDDPTRLIGIAPEGMVNVYRIDFDTGKWSIEETYATGRLGDSLFPNAGAFRAIRRNGQLFLFHRVVPAVLRLDAKLRQAVPVAIAGRVINKGRTFFQFAGTGREGYPKPWVAAAEHHGYSNLSTAPKLYSWADTNGNGRFEPTEFRFHPDAKRGVSFHNPGDFTSSGDYIGSAKTNEPQALVRLPVSNWEGPNRTAPRWDWDRVEPAGEMVADTKGYGSPRGVSVGPDDSVSVAYQAGIMIRNHGQYEGGGWPEAGLKGSRVLGFNSKLQPKFAVGRQSKIAGEENSGLLYYPMQTTNGPNRCVIVNDQTKQPAQVWTHDGLFVGGLLDNRADDGRVPGFYRVHGDDNQGATVVTAHNGKTYWLMPYQGHNRLYEITGWDSWQRRSGDVSTPSAAARSEPGTGLAASYFQGSKLVHETVETPIYFNRFSGEPHTDKLTAHYKAVWTGYVVPPVSDRFKFQSLLGKSEQVSLWIDGRLVHANGFATRNVGNAVELVAGHRHRIHIEYINPSDRAELKLLWRSRIIDPQPMPKAGLYAR